MSAIAIQVEDLSKQYHIGSQQKTYDKLSDQLGDMLISPLRRAGKLLRGQATGAAELDETIWALKDASLEINQGEVVGIIGRNGAGKSTLLKILSRITEPTEGYVDIYGRVGSLLEVGTGFHPELTGRENVFLNGAILGMKKVEIEHKFDEIVAFAEIDKFIDTPVKHYSSGMYVRLAFSVAAHLEPEILLVDEVLAVGDVAFQKKCLGKMDEVSNAGRTVLFVSHNMAAVQNLCVRGIWLKQGQVAFDGPVDEAVRNYLGYLSSNADRAFVDNPERTGDGRVQLTGARILNGFNQPSQHLVAGEPMSLEFSYKNPARASQAYAATTVFNHLGVAATSFDMRLTSFLVEDLASEGKFICRVPNVPFPVGQYRVAVAIYVDEQIADLIPNALVFNVESTTFFENGSRTPSLNYCTCMVSHNWQHKITEPRLPAPGTAAE